MRILIHQKGGLGNQLFQYAAGLYYAKKYRATLEFIKLPDDWAGSYGHPRPFALSNYCISEPFREGNSWDRLMWTTSMKKKLIVFFAKYVSHTAVWQQPEDDVWTFLPELPISKSIQCIYLKGYFQAYKYVQEVEQQLRTELRLREAPSGKNIETLNEIHSCECAVSLHIRLGDYKVDHGGRSLLPITYYQRAIQAMNDRLRNPTYFIFSDEIDFARECLPKFERMVFVDHNNEEAAHEDLRLMSACRHHIIANSTFSWWGAWLNPNTEKIVFYPDRWFNMNPVQPDLMPPTWRSIATDADNKQLRINASQPQEVSHEA
jgi:hypothetical protein